MGRKSKYNFKDMEVGDFFVVETEHPVTTQRRVTAAARSWKIYRDPDFRIKVKCIEGGVKVTRMCMCKESTWNRDAGCMICDNCGERI